MKTKRLMLLSAIIALALAAVVCLCLFSAYASPLTSDRLVFDGVKYKVAQVAPSGSNFSDSRKGLRLYAYDSGAKATIKGAFKDVFEAEVKASTQDAARPELLAYSFVFESLTGDERFKLTIEDSGTETEAYVDVNGEKAGVYYNIDAWNNDAHGYTTIQNAAGIYTLVLTSGTTFVRFDPSAMEASVGDGNGGYKLVWDLSESKIDGKPFPYVFGSMDLYTVSIEFTSVMVGGKGDLTVYSVNGEDYGALTLPEVAPLLKAEVTEHAVAGRAFSIPAPFVYDAAEAIGEEDVSYEIYDEAGELLAEGAYTGSASYTFASAGNYYLYYFAEGASGVKAEAYCKLKAYAEQEIGYSFTGDVPAEETLGVNASLYIPARTAESNLFAEGYTEEALVTIKKDGVPVEGYENIAGGFDFVFPAAGEYTVVYSVRLGGVERTEDAAVIEVSDGIAGIVCDGFEEVYYCGETLVIPAAAVYLNGTSGAAAAEIAFPDGTVSTSDEIVLDQTGNYTVTYTYSVGGSEGEFSYEFSAELRAEDLFRVNEDASLAFDGEAGNADMPGLVYTMNSGSASLSVDVDLSDNTKTDILLEVLAVPATPGVPDMTGFYITLTDKLDPDNYLTLRLIKGDGLNSSGTFLKGRASNQYAYTAWYKSPDWDAGAPYPYVEELEAVMSHNSGGFLPPFNLGMNTFRNDLDTMTLQIMFDASENAVYANNDLEYVHDETYRERLVVDFDDSAMFSNLWAGFTDYSQVEMTITPIAVTGSAKLKIFNVDGLTFGSDAVKDENGPVLTVDMDGMAEAPDAKVGVPYKLFAVTAEDDFCDASSVRVTSRVLFGNETVEVKNGAFTPAQAGRYTIEYTAKDGYGNSTVRRIEVEARTDISPVRLVMNEDWAEKLQYGVPVTFPDYAGEGGSGRYYYSQTVTCNGDPVEAEGGGFTPLADGEYVVTLRVDDYLGQSDTETKTYTVSYEALFVFEEDSILLPPAFLAGNPYVFTEYTAGYYAAEGSERSEAVARIEVTDGNGTHTVGADGLYTPAAGSPVKEAAVRIIFEAQAGGKTIEKTIERTVPIVELQSGSGFITQYFLLGNGTMTARNQYITLEAAAAGDVTAQFIRAVPVDEFSMEFKANEQDGVVRSGFDALEITLTDKYDPSVQLVFTLRNDGDGITLLVNGKDPRSMFGSFADASGQNIVLSYSDADLALSGAESSSLGVVEEDAQGRPFGGFPSKEVYVTLRLVGAESGSALNVVSLDNQLLFNAMTDTTQPLLYVDGSYSGMFTVGSEVTLPAARAYDVLNYTTPAALTVTYPDGSYVTSVDGVVLNGAPADREYTILTDRLGNYSVSYSTTDLSGRYREAAKQLSVFDDVLPSLTLDEALPERVWEGTEVSIPSYTVTDNGDLSKVTVEAFYIDAGGLMHTASGVIVADKAGTYTLCFLLTDENGNMNTVVYSFVAVVRQ